MKQLLNFNPAFSPGSSGVGYLDFTQYPQFSINKLYAVVNVTRGTPIYVPGTSKYNLTAISGSILTLGFDTSTHSQLDKIEVYYDTYPGIDLNQSIETGGQLQKLQETCNRMLKELIVMNYVIANGLNIKQEDVDSLRNDVFTEGNNSNTTE